MFAAQQASYGIRLITSTLMLRQAQHEDLALGLSKGEARIIQANSVSQVRNRIGEFTSNQRGSVAVFSVVAMIPFLVAAGTAVDMGRANYTLGHMQKTVDTAALAAAATQQSMTTGDGLKLSGDEAKIHVAKTMVDANLPDHIKSATKPPEVTLMGDQVMVNLQAEMATSLIKIVGIKTVSLAAASTAQAAVDAKACIVALGDNGGGIEVGGNVDLEVEGCWLYSNKAGDKSIDLVGGAQVETPGSRAAGSISVSNNATLTGDRHTNSHTLADPMADWTHPTIPSGCDYNSFNQSSSSEKNIVLWPGVYCGGLRINGYDNVHFKPGTYYIQGGQLRINSNVEITGEDVGFYLANDVPSVTINGGAKLSLTASSDEPMDGVLVAMQPGAKKIISATINGGADLTLGGTIYVPEGDLNLSGNSTTQAKATQLIAHSVKLSGTSNMNFKADFGAAGYPTRGEFVSTVRLIK